MSMTEAELLKWNQQLVRRDEEWAQRKVDAERWLAKVNAEMATLTPKVERLKEIAADYQTSNEQSSKVIDDRKSVLNDVNQEIDRSNRQLASLTDELRVVGQEITTKRATIDDNMIAYERERVNGIEVKIAATETRLSGLNEHIIELKKDIAHKEGILESLQSQTAILVSNLDLAQLTNAEEINKLQDDILSVRRANERTIAEHLRLEAARTELEQENARISKETAEFSKWQDRAMRELEIADKALQAREAAIEQREQYRPVRKSFLPPTTE